MNNSPVVRIELKNKIREIAQKLDYVPNASAYSLRKRINRSIALVLPYLKFPGGEFYQEIIRGIDEYVEEYKFSIILANFSRENNSFIRIVRENRVDGAIIIGDIFSTKELKEIDSLSLPVVIVNQKVNFRFKHIIDVYSNNIQGAMLLTEHLADTHKRKRMLFLGGGKKYQTNNDRIKGFKRIAEKYRIKYEIVEAKFEEAGSGYWIIKNFIKQRKFSFDAIIRGNDTLAMGVIKALMEDNVDVPQKVSVVGYDNIQLTQFYNIPITTVDPSAHLMGRKAGEVLLKWITEKKIPSERKIKVPSQLIIRESCGCKGGK